MADALSREEGERGRPLNNWRHSLEAEMKSARERSTGQNAMERLLMACATVKE